MAQQGEGAEGVGVELLEPVALQLNEPEPRQSLEGIGVDGLQAVVVQVEACQAPEPTQRPPMQLTQLVVAQLQHLATERDGERKGV